MAIRQQACQAIFKPWEIKRQIILHSYTVFYLNFSKNCARNWGSDLCCCVKTPVLLVIQRCNTAQC